MTTKPPDLLVTQFRLILDGVDDKTIAEALVAAVGLERAGDLCFKICDAAPVALPFGWTAKNIKLDIVEELEFEEEEFIGTLEDVAAHIKALEDMDVGDVIYEAKNVILRERIISPLKERGLIVSKHKPA